MPENDPAPPAPKRARRAKKNTAAPSLEEAPHAAEVSPETEAAPPVLHSQGARNLDGTIEGPPLAVVQEG